MRGKSFLRPAVLGAGLAALLAFGSGCGQKSEAAGSSPVSEAGKAAETEAGREETAVSDAVEWSDMTVSGSMDLTYAEQFSVDYYDGGYALIAIDSSGKYLTVPEGCPVPAGLPEDIVPVFQPLDHIYLAATSAMDLFAGLDSVDRITMSGTDASGWYIEEARQAMEAVGVLHLADKHCSKMSGGELQMVLIARALAARPQLLVLDEPESNLDFKNQLIILDTIRSLAEHSSYIKSLSYFCMRSALICSSSVNT